MEPTPRYAEVPRWGLQQPFEVEGPTTTTQTGGPAPTLVRGLIIATMALYGVAALSYLVRYALMLVNRTVLIDPILDAVVTWGAVAFSVLALFALIGMAVVLANWLVARREAAYARFEKPDTRSTTEILAGCLVPVANLFFAPVLVFELAMVEARMRDLRTRIVVWWCLWVVSFFLSGYAAIAGLPFVARDAQSIADSNLTTAIAYLFALAALASLYKVFAGFERSGVTESVKRWVVVRADGSPQSPRADTESAIPVESERRDPAA